jgi:hypothetical protein
LPYLVGPRFLPAWKRQNMRQKTLHTVTCYPLPVGTGGATQIGSKRTFQIKLGNGLTSSRVATTFTVPRPLDPTRADSDRFSFLWVGRKAHAKLGSWPTSPMPISGSPTIRKISHFGSNPFPPYLNIAK